MQEFKQLVNDMSNLTNDIVISFESLKKKLGDKVDSGRQYKMIELINAVPPKSDHATNLELSNNNTLKDIINDVSVVKNEAINCYNILKSKVEKNLEGSNSYKFIDLVNAIKFENAEVVMKPLKDWVYDKFSGKVTDIVSDNHYVFACSEDSSVRKISKSKTEVWVYNNKMYDKVKCVAVNSNIVSMGLSGTCGIEVINTDGTHTRNNRLHSNIVNDIKLDNNNKIYSCSDDSTIKKSGERYGTIGEIWTYSKCYYPINSIVLDSENNIYGICEDNTLRKINNNGGEIWSKQIPAYGECIDIDSKGNLVICCGKKVLKFTNDLSPIWEYDLGRYNAKSVHIDNRDSVYVGNNYGDVIKINNSGKREWIVSDHYQDVVGISSDDEGAIYSCSYDGRIERVKQIPV